MGMVTITYVGGSVSTIQDNTKLISIIRNGIELKAAANTIQAGDMMCFCTGLAHAEVESVVVS